MQISYKKNQVILRLSLLQIYYNTAQQLLHNSTTLRVAVYHRNKWKTLNKIIYKAINQYHKKNIDLMPSSVYIY